MISKVAQGQMDCPICDVRDVAPLYEGLIKCRRCGFAWLDQDLSHDELIRLYSDNYFLSGEYEDYVAQEEALTLDFAKLLDIVKRYAKGNRLLEVGSAYGFFLNLASSAFNEVVGVELNQTASDYARKRFGLDIRT